jgi:type VI secretion system secreted protein VgrG
MSKFVNSKIILGGRDFSSQPLLVRQAIDGHHYFEVRLRYDTAQKGQLLKEAQALIGEKAEIDIRWEHKTKLGIIRPEPGSSNIFLGLVTEVGLSRGSQRHNEIIISGHGPTNLLDDGPQVRSFSKKSLQNIASAIIDPLSPVIKKLEIKVKTIIDPSKLDSLEYIVQYNESDFAFLRRLASRFGEWFFYNGEELIFGKLPEKDQLPLKFGTDLLNFNLSVKAVPVNFKLKAYDYTISDFHEKKPDYPINELDEYSKLAIKKSQEKLYPHEPFTIATRNMDKNELSSFVKRRGEARLNELVYLSGSSTNPHIRIGEVISISDPDMKPTEDAYGSYLVTHIVHDLSDVSEYSNFFQAIPVEAASPLVHANIVEPFCDSQLARVVDVNDTDGLGRVKVKFPWQEETNETTPMIRVVTPHASGDRGIYFTPELGDQVVVNFEYNDPEKPYVAGSLYHGKAAPSIFKHAQNVIKAIRTISGNEILFNDSEGLQHIRISTPGMTNEILLTMDAGNKITIRTKGNLIVYAEDSISMEAENDIKIKANKIDIEATEKYSLNTEEIKIGTAEGSDQPKLKTYKLKSTEIEIGTDETNQTSLKSSNIDIEGTATNIKGKPIRLN